MELREVKKMVDEIILNDLANTSCKNWKKVIDRHRVLGEYCRIGRPSTTDADHCANHLGISRRMFYRLVKRHGAKLTGTFGRVDRRRPDIAIGQHQEDLIADAIAQAPAGASVTEVCELVGQLGCQRGIAVPCEATVKKRLRNGDDVAGLNGRLTGQRNWVLDACATDVAIRDGERARWAWLFALIDCRSGEILRHAFVGRLSRPSEVGSLFTNIAEILSSEIGAERSLGLASCLEHHADTLACLLRPHQIQVLPIGSELRSGEAIQRILGIKLGKVCLRTMHERSAPSVENAVPIDVGSAVVAKLIQQRVRKAEDIRSLSPSHGVVARHALSESVFPAPQ
jgi:hypothetical protein